jgi:hypothetical protein
MPSAPPSAQHSSLPVRLAKSARIEAELKAATLGFLRSPGLKSPFGPTRDELTEMKLAAGVVTDKH